MKDAVSYIPRPLEPEPPEADARLFQKCEGHWSREAKLFYRIFRRVRFATDL